MSVKLQSKNKKDRSRFKVGKLASLAIAIVIISVLLYVILSWRPDIHDVALATVVPSSAAVPQGLDIKINVTVRNQGSWTETSDVNITVPTSSGVQTFSQEVRDLGVGESRILTFIWRTGNLVVGDYHINVTLGQVANETDLSDNTLGTVLTLSNTVRLVTSFGNITIGLFEDMNITTRNFKNLTWIGIYDNTIFHRVSILDEQNFFVIQGGDPTGTGSGDPSISRIPDELPNKHNNTWGTVAMAKTNEPDSATSQFFINLNDNRASLDTNYTVFGWVESGMDKVISKVQYLVENDLIDESEKPKEDLALIRAEFVR